MSLELLKASLKPFDIVTVDGQWFMPHHKLIQWRTLDKSVHCFVVMDETGSGYSPQFNGIKVYNLFEHYKGRSIQVHRYKYLVDPSRLRAWCGAHANAKYDFWSQWIFGFVFGCTKAKLINDEDRYTCSEFAYWMFQDSGITLTSKEEELPMPRLFRFHKEFTKIFEGKI